MTVDVAIIHIEESEYADAELRFLLSASYMACATARRFDIEREGVISA